LAELVEVADQTAERFFHLGDKFVLRQVGIGPLLARLQDDVGIGRVRRHRIARDLGRAGARENQFYLWEGLELVLHLSLHGERAFERGRRYPQRLNRDVPLVELGRELAAEKGKHQSCYGKQPGTRSDHRPWACDGTAQGRAIAFLRDPDRLDLLLGQLAIEEHRDHRRDKGQRQHEGGGERQHDRDGHGRERLALDTSEGEKRRINQEDDRLAVDGRPDHLLCRQPRLGQPLAEAEQSAFVVLPRSEPRDAVLDDDDRAIDDEAEVKCPEAHQIARHSKPVHSHGGHQHGYRNDQCSDDRCPDIAEHQEQDCDNQERALDEVLFNGCNSRIDERRAVVDDFGDHSGRERGANFFQSFGRGGSHGAAVLAAAHEDRTHNRLLAIERGSTGSEVAADANRGDISDPDRNALAGRDDRLFDILRASKPRIDADEQSLSGAIDEVGALSKVRRFQSIDQGVERQAVAGQPGGIGLDQELLLVATDRVHACDAID